MPQKREIPRPGESRPRNSASAAGGWTGGLITGILGRVVKGRRRRWGMGESLGVGSCGEKGGW